MQTSVSTLSSMQW